ncbi:MAG: hypothetical protein RLZZ86_1239 [Cyanobacteriota bacterium]|jgi:hypothetical protein
MAKIGTIYRIEFKEDPDIRYIGSTLNELKYRWKQHKNDFLKYKKGKGNLASIHPYFEKYGIENFGITAIKRYAVCDRTHLKVYEQLWMNKLKCINIHPTFGISYLTRKKYREEHKEEIAEKKRKQYEENKENVKLRSKQWRENNKERYIETKKKYCENNKEAVAQRKKNWYEENKEEIIEKSKNNYEKNKEKILERHRQRITCEICKCEIGYYDRHRHNKTKKHQDNLAKLEEEKSKE